VKRGDYKAMGMGQSVSLIPFLSSDVAIACMLISSDSAFPSLH